MITNQNSLRINYANRRRNSIHKRTNRVVWKTRSRHVA